MFQKKKKIPDKITLRLYTVNYFFYIYTLRAERKNVFRLTWLSNRFWKRTKRRLNDEQARSYAQTTTSVRH